VIDELVAATLAGPHLQTDPEGDGLNDIIDNDWGGDNNSAAEDDEGEDLRYEAFEEIVKPK
jgi:hypothetical protein